MHDNSEEILTKALQNADDDRKIISTMITDLLTYIKGTPERHGVIGS